MKRVVLLLTFTTGLFIMNSRVNFPQNKLKCFETLKVKMCSMCYKMPLNYNLPLHDYTKIEKTKGNEKY